MSERSKEGKTMKKMDKPLFTEEFARGVGRAIQLNRDETGDIYHHPSEKKIVRKCIDLSCCKPLHEIGNKPRSNSAEKWLEAYLIRKAKRNDWVLKLAGRRFRFLYSQLNFRGTKGKPPRPLDLLLYELTTGHLVVMELKARRELGKAIEELDHYSDKVGKIREEIACVFSLGQIREPEVRGYIVWPENERADNRKHNFGKHGLIEYTSPHGIIKNGKLVEPWEQFKERRESLAIEFVFKDFK
jgi:hypothetical protein